jgi:hypothetical protein
MALLHVYVELVLHETPEATERRYPGSRHTCSPAGPAPRTTAGCSPRPRLRLRPDCTIAVTATCGFGQRARPGYHLPPTKREALGVPGLPGVLGTRSSELRHGHCAHDPDRVATREHGRPAAERGAGRLRLVCFLPGTAGHVRDVRSLQRPSIIHTSGVRRRRVIQPRPAVAELLGQLNMPWCGHRRGQRPRYVHCGARYGRPAWPTRTRADSIRPRADADASAGTAVGAVIANSSRPSGPPSMHA